MKVIIVMLEKILVNNEIKTMIATFGCGIGDEFDINKLKYELPYLAVKKNTQWAHEYIPEYGDIIISFTSAESLNDIYTKLVYNEIEKQEQIIEEHKKILNILRTAQYGKIV